MREGGHAAVELALGVGLLLLPVALVVMSFGPWLERRVVAEAAASEAARATVLTLDHLSGNRSAFSVASAHGLEVESIRIGWCGASPASIEVVAGSCALTRGSAVEARVDVWAPLFSTPWGEVGGLWVGSSHVEWIDLYRSLP